MGLEVLLGGRHELDGDELEAAVLEARDDGADEATLDTVSTPSPPQLQSQSRGPHTWTPSGLIAMKLQKSRRQSTRPK